MTAIALPECATFALHTPRCINPRSSCRCAGLRTVTPDFNVGNSILVFELDQKRLQALLDGPAPAEVGTGDMPYLQTTVQMP